MNPGSDARTSRNHPWLSALCALALSAAVTAEEVTITHGGLTLNANLEHAGNTDLSGGVVLLTHGTLQHNRMEIIRSAQELLTENGIASLALNFSYGLDNRHGVYDCQVPHRYTRSDSVEEIAVWANWLTSRGAGGVVLLGHSSSGNLALAAAVDKAPPGVVGVVLLAPNTTAHERLIRAYQNRYKVDPTVILARARELVNAGRGDELMSVDYLICPKTQVSAEAFLDFYRANPLRFNLSGYLAKADKPTLVIAASADEIQPNVETYVRPEVDGKRVRLYVVEDSGHFFRDLNLEDAMDAIVPFVEEVL